MQSIQLKATITQNVTIEFLHKEIILYLEQTDIKLLKITSYKEYLEFVNASKPNWSIRQQHDIYKWMRENNWL